VVGFGHGHGDPVKAGNVDYGTPWELEHG